MLSGEDDTDPTQREAGLVDACAVAELLDGVVLVGGRVSSGMAREERKASRTYNLIDLGDEPPDVVADASFEGFMWEHCRVPAPARHAPDLHHSQGVEISEVLAAAAKDRGE